MVTLSSAFFLMLRQRQLNTFSNLCALDATTQITSSGDIPHCSWSQVDKGFVAQVAAVVGGRKAPMNEEQEQQAEKSIVGEFSTVKHVRGILSMGRHSDPDSGSSSFSILLGDAPHLDGQYAVFGRVTKGDNTLRKLERLPTRREGIFVMILK
ncbi:hypothetical protein BRADI_4g14140v3 [Brachypodium distachyon]|uniref:PPIase cyclophilin-type domain-containing protein n=1 Tax=Brachypodium distachyon TaxID=15368 RepID=A0A0Q3L5H0_BRADI|nr:hypothetical protein BRADI_4g14140v3 [Brachypodium distachyon]